MGALIVHQGATVTCIHQGMAQPTIVSPRVRVSGQSVITQATPFLITVCALSSTSTPPCATAQWIKGAARVLVNGMPVITRSSQALCTPTGQGLRVITTQTRVFAA